MDILMLNSVFGHLPNQLTGRSKGILAFHHSSQSFPTGVEKGLAQVG